MPILGVCAPNPPFGHLRSHSKHISNAFEAKHVALLVEDPSAAEDPDEYLAENVFWVPQEARWPHLPADAKQPIIGKLIDVQKNPRLFRPATGGPAATLAVEAFPF